ncbi:hypothetical protein LTR17_021670 [Elasticomyces elasticus]|nr:hypothetical protein LTR17_021670 [Elasticomyces elasticus]
MATAAMPAQSASIHNFNGPKLQRHSFNPNILTAKLQALQFEDIYIEPAAKRDPSKRASYVPRNAATVFAATTTPAPRQGVSDVRRAKSVVQRQKPAFTAVGDFCINPKQLHAAMNMGMTATEAAANIAAIPGPPSASTEKQRRSSSNDKIRQQRQVDTVPERRASAGAYKPGDAAKRNAVRRHSVQPPAQGKLVTFTHGPQTAYEREAVFSSGSAILDNDEDHHVELHHAELHRPAIRPQDRPNWAQQSQCGEEVHHFWRHSKAPHAEGGSDGSRHHIFDGPKPARPQAPRQKSLNSIPENLVTDAVSKIKKEEKANRRRSIVSFFRKL